MSAVELWNVSVGSFGGGEGATNGNLLSLFGDTHAVVDQIGVVAEQGISTVLGNDTQRNQKCQAVTVTLGPHEIQIAAVLLVPHLQADSLLNLTVFKLNSGVVLISIAVVVGKCVQCFFVSLLRDEPTGRFRDP